MIKINWDLPFLEQLDYLRSKGIVLSPESWRDVWKQANSRAFTVARVTEMDILHDIKSALDQAMESGATLKDFKAGLKDTLESKGWLAPEGEKAKIILPDGSTRKRLTGWRLDNIYATNSQEAYSTGRYKQLQEVKDSRPYWMYVAVMDSATRPNHAALNGKISQAFGRPIKPKKVTVKAHIRKISLPWGDIPARPFMMIQDDDWTEIKETLAEFLLRKEGCRLLGKII